jgi:hypothetical protein
MLSIHRRNSYSFLTTRVTLFLISTAYRSETYMWALTALATLLRLGRSAASATLSTPAVRSSLRTCSIVHRTDSIRDGCFNRSPVSKHPKGKGKEATQSAYLSRVKILTTRCLGQGEQAPNGLTTSLSLP